MEAWRTYWNARLPDHVGRILFELRTLRLTEREATDLANRIEFLAAEVAKLEAEKIENERRAAEQNAGRK